jgi:hypothetical protein
MKAERQRHNKRRHRYVNRHDQARKSDQAELTSSATNINGLDGLPVHPTSRALSRRALLHLQRCHGNSYVQRKLARLSRRGRTVFEAERGARANSESSGESSRHEMVSGHLAGVAGHWHSVTRVQRETREEALGAGRAKRTDFRGRRELGLKDEATGKRAKSLEGDRGIRSVDLANMKSSNLVEKLIQRVPAPGSNFGTRRGGGFRITTKIPGFIKEYFTGSFDVDYKKGSYGKHAWASVWELYDSADKKLDSNEEIPHGDYAIESEKVDKGTPGDGRAKWSLWYRITRSQPWLTDNDDAYPYDFVTFDVYSSPIKNPKTKVKEETGPVIWQDNYTPAEDGASVEYNFSTTAKRTETESQTTTVSVTVGGEKSTSLGFEFEGLTGGFANKLSYSATQSMSRTHSLSVETSKTESKKYSQTNLKAGNTYKVIARPLFHLIEGSVDLISHRDGVITKGGQTITGGIRLLRGLDIKTEKVAKNGRKTVLDMSPEEFEKDKEAQRALFAMAKDLRGKQQSFADTLLSENKIRGGKAKSILKRDNFDEFVKGVVAKCKRNGYTRIGQMDDIVRGRFDLRTEKDVNTIAAALKDQSKYPVTQIIAPRRPQKDGGFGYPRWHIIVKAPDTGLTHEWQVGTRAVTEVFETPGIKLPEGVKLGPGMKNDLHDIEYDIFRVGIKRKYPKVHKRHGLPEFHKEVDAVAAEAGRKGAKTPDLKKKIVKLHEDAAMHLQKLVDEFGPDWLKQFYH